MVGYLSNMDAMTFQSYQSNYGSKEEFKSMNGSGDKSDVVPISDLEDGLPRSVMSLNRFVKRCRTKSCSASIEEHLQT